VHRRWKRHLLGNGGGGGEEDRVGFVREGNMDSEKQKRKGRDRSGGVQFEGESCEGKSKIALFF